MFNIFRAKKPDIFSLRAFISRADGGCLSNCPNSKKKFPALENSWLRAFLVFYLFF